MSQFATRITTDFIAKVGLEKYGKLSNATKTQFEKLAKDIAYLHQERLRREFDLEAELKLTVAQYLNLEIEGMADLKEIFNESLADTLDAFVGPLLKVVKGLFS